MDFNQVAYNVCSTVPGRPNQVTFKKPGPRDSGKAREVAHATVLGFKTWVCEAPCSKYTKKKK